MTAPSTAGPTIERGWQEAVASDGTTLAWRMDGPPARTGRRPVLLCNGIACDDAYWSRLLLPLTRERVVVRWDYRGHGRSATPSDPSRTTMDEIVDDLATVLAATRLEAPVLVGHSFGVQVMLEALRHPDLGPCGLVAVAGSAGRPLPAAAGASLPLLEGLRRSFPAAAGALWRGIWTGRRVVPVARLAGGLRASTPPDVLGSYVAHAHGLDLATLSGMFRAMQGHDAIAAADHLDVPLLVIAGARDGLARLSAVRELALRAPDGELVIVPGAAHTLPVEAPDAVLEVLLPFLAQLDAAGGRQADARGHAS